MGNVREAAMTMKDKNDCCFVRLRIAAAHHARADDVVANGLTDETLE